MLYTELYRVLWRRKVLVTIGTLLCVATALVLTSRQEKTYLATATVRVEPVERTNANDSFEASQRLSRSYAEIYTQGAVIPAMTRDMAGQAPPKKSELAAQQVKDLDFLAVSGVASNARRAATIANAGARALEQFSPRERLAPISRASPPGDPASPNVRMSVLLALVGGFILSAGAALMLDALLQPIPDARELGQSLQLPVLGVIPRLNLAAGTETRRRVDPGREFSPDDAHDLAGLTATDGASGRVRGRLRGGES